MTPEEAAFAKKLRDKAKLDPVYREAPLTTEQRLARLERENEALRANQGKPASQQKPYVPEAPRPEPKGLAEKLARRREDAKGLDGSGTPLTDMIMYNTDASGPIAPGTFGKTKE